MKTLFKSLLILAATAVGLAACAVKEDLLLDNNSESITFFLNDNVKAVLENNYIAWQEGDNIGWANSRNTTVGSSAINLSTTPYSFTVTNTTNSNWGNNSTAKTTFYFYAPYKDGSSKTAAKFSIPAEQDGKLTNAMPMVAPPFEHSGQIKRTNGTASFNNEDSRLIQFIGLASIAQFRVYTTNAEYGSEKVQSVNFTSTSNIAGDFAADITNVSESNIPSPSGLSGKSISASPIPALAVGSAKSDACKVNMSIAPGTWSGTVTVETTGASYVIPVNNITFNRGRILPLNVDLANPNATRTEKTASSVETLLRSTTWQLESIMADWSGTDSGTPTDDNLNGCSLGNRITFNADYTMTFDCTANNGKSWSYYVDAPIKPVGVENMSWSLVNNDTQLYFPAGSYPLFKTNTGAAVTYTIVTLNANSLVIKTNITWTEGEDWPYYFYYVPASGTPVPAEPLMSAEAAETLLMSTEWMLTDVQEDDSSITSAIGNKISFLANQQMSFDCSANEGLTFDHTWEGSWIQPNFYGEVSDMIWYTYISADNNLCLGIEDGYLLVFAQSNTVAEYEITQLTANSFTAVIYDHFDNGTDSWDETFTLYFQKATSGGGGGGGNTVEELLTMNQWTLTDVTADWDLDGSYGYSEIDPANNNHVNCVGNKLSFVKNGNTRSLSFDCSAHGGKTDNFYTDEVITPANVSSMSWSLTNADTKISFPSGSYPIVQMGSGGAATFDIAELTPNSLILKTSLWGYPYFVHFSGEGNGSSGGGGSVDGDPFNSLSLAQIRSQYEPVWKDDFTGTSVDTGNNGWSFETGGTGWGNNELQYYVNQSVTVSGTTYKTAEVSDGTLKINGYKVSYSGKNYISTRMSTKKYWKHGLIEMRAKLPTTKGCWSAFWMLPKYGSSYVRDSSKDGGELDIIEYVPTDNTEAKRIYFSAHSYYTTKEAEDNGDYVSYPNNVGYNSKYSFSTATAAAEWHTYSMLWTDKFVKAYVDDVLYYNAPNPYPGQHNLPYWGFDQEFYIKLNLAIGGDWGGTPASSWPQPAVFEVDYVQVYQSGY